MQDEQVLRLLEAEAARFRERYPHSHVRFAEVLGRRVSHLVGSAAEAHPGERKVPVCERLVMLVHDGDEIGEAALEALAAAVAGALPSRNDLPPDSDSRGGR